MTDKRRKLIVWGIVAVGVLFALQGGQYSSLDLLRQGSEKKNLVREIDSLKAEVDSLRSYKKALANDTKLQERIARELWGMVKENEVVYQLQPPGRSR